MRCDGTAAYYLIQHQEESERWVESALDHFLFSNLTYTQRCNRGDKYRKMLAPQSANSDLWQKFGINGFEAIGDAETVLAEVKKLHPGRAFRLVYRVSMQATAEVG